MGGIAQLSISTVNTRTENALIATHGFGRGDFFAGFTSEEERRETGIDLARALKNLRPKS
jgi:hypothetical protein